MKIRLKIIAILLVLNGILCFPSIMAYFVRQEKVSNELIMPEVSCVINETFNGQEKKSVTVKNTSDIKAYIRVKIIHHWVDSKGAPVGLKSELEAFGLAPNWKKIGDNYYYYTLPVDPSTAPIEMLGVNQSIQLDNPVHIVEGDITFDYYHAVEIYAEAIQADPTSTVSDVWNVAVNGNGTITGAK